METDRACEAEVLGRRTRTFEVAGHHYALVVVDGLEPGSEHEYQVALDGTVRWPEAGSRFPPSALRTLDPGRPQRLVFGSCRTPELPAGHGPDALAGCARGVTGTPRDRWPGAMLLIGDQIYADETGPAARRFIAGRRDPAVPPGYEAADFEEYCALYLEAWSEPAVRWLLSAVPTVMIFDDHDVHDDWNSSAAWRAEFEAKPWWRARITGAYQSYWIYQHLGNLSPAGLAADETWRQVRQAVDQAGDAAAVLEDFALRADRRAAGIRFSVRRDFGKVRVVVIDSRSRRVIGDNSKRLMVDEAEWSWVTESVAGDWDHVVLATSLPVLLPRGIHGFEGWNEAVCSGAWGRRFAQFGERVRQAVDLEHWASFGRSFENFERLLAELAAGAYGARPASVIVVSGDVHNSYLAPARLPAAAGARSPVWQVVSSPVHNLLPARFRRGYQLAGSAAGALAGSALARLAGVGKPTIRWRVTAGPWFDNMLCALDFDGRAARVRFDRAVRDDAGQPSLQPAYEARLTD
jgi:hypothetical protein